MHLKPNAFGLAAGVLTAVSYSLCSAAYVLFNEQFMSFMNLISHNFDFSVLEGGGLTWESFFVGLVAWTVMSYVSGVVFGWLYNKLAK